MSGSSPATEKKSLLSNTLYDVAKKTTTLVLPAVGTLYFALAQIWSFPKPEAVIGTIAAITTFLGVVLHISSSSYNETATVGPNYMGDLVVTPHSEDSSKKILVAHTNEVPSEIAKMDEVTFKVRSEDTK